MNLRNHLPVALLAASILGSVGPAQAALINAGFENTENPLAGWSSNGGSDAQPFVPEVKTDYVGDLGTPYLPNEGNHFLVLTAGDPGPKADKWQTVSQAFHAGKGNVVSGWAAFDWQDSIGLNPDGTVDPLNDYPDGARVRILDSTGAEIAIPYFKVGQIGQDLADYPWTSWSWSALTDGDYILEFGVFNSIDNANPSVGLFDASFAAVPLPPAMWLLGSALAAMTVFPRRLTA